MAKEIVNKKTNILAAAVGRRKEAVARVRLIKGLKEVTINNQPYTQYFVSLINQRQILKPFEITKTLSIYGATVLVKGGGLPSQLGATIHGLSRVLAKVDPEKYRKSLKDAGLLTRDPRAKERRKYGLAGKARAKKQSPKR